jgi:REP element-mobilizing transposase RayT
MLRRWWVHCDLPIYLACDGNLQEYKDTYDINIIEQEKDYGFVEGRVHALKLLEEYDNVIMLQDDFIIERFVDNDTIHKLIEIMNNDKNIGCIRLMPCPGPKGKTHLFGNGIQLGEFERECWCRFSFQAAIWKREYYIRFFEELKEDIKKNIYKSTYKKDADALINDSEYWRKLWFKSNIAENRYGCKFTLRYPEVLLGIIRDGEYSNAVYRSPIPYRPTAIVRGKLEDWAKDLFKRENINIT